MRSGKGNIYIAGALIVFVAGPLSAETRSGFSFLKIGVGARAIGLGSAYTALANDVTSIYWNPAGLAVLKKREFSGMHGQWLAGSNFDFLGLGGPVSSGVLALSISGLTHPSLEERDETGRLLGGFNARDISLGLAYAGSWRPQLHGGLGVKYIQSQIGSDKGEGLALDLGTRYHALWAPLTIGLSLQNLGPGIRFINERTPLPLTAALGAAWHLLPGLALSADIKQYIYDKKTSVSLGTEYMALPSFALRGGYMLSNQKTLTNASRDLGLGFGLQLLGSRLDYAFTPFGELRETHRINLTGKF